MTLLTAHRILIATSVLFFFGFGLWELRNYAQAGEAWAFFRGILYVLVAGGFGGYLVSLRRGLR